MKRTPLKRGKPLKAGKPLARGPHGLKRTKRLKARKTPRAFRQRRDPAYTRWVRQLPCVLAGIDTTRRLSLRDTANVQPNGTLDGEPTYLLRGGAYWHHICLGPVDAAHVGPHRAHGAPDAGAVVPLCRAAHRAYDEHRERWKHLVAPPVNLEALAARLWGRYQRETGAP